MPPLRRPSETPSHSDYALSRKTSSESVSSIATARSSVSGMSNTTSGTSRSDRFVIRAPSYDSKSVPPLPPKRTEEQKQAYYGSAKDTARRSLKSTFSSPNIQAEQVGTTPPPARRPSAHPQPAMDLRRVSIAEEEPQQPVVPQQQREIAPPPPQRPKRSALEMGFGNKANQPSNGTPPNPGVRPSIEPPISNEPPPVPKDSRPDLAALQASKPKPNGSAASPTPGEAGSVSTSTCLICRDFSAADEHSARFPLHSIPYKDVGWLAKQLTAPFPSTTDKARAIFTWLHHNISYNTEAFFSGNVKPSTPQSTLESGLAVCEGYAGLFAALAMKAGLQAYVVSGHGKGFSHSEIKAGDPMPAYKAGHAWNAVKLDDSLGCGPGQWKLIDACWGAGHLSGPNHLYEQHFSPERFTQSNDDFGLDHYPGDVARQFRNDGRQLSWEEYVLGDKKGCAAVVHNGFMASEGISGRSIQPTANTIAVRQLPGPTMRFAFQKLCPHWDPHRNGKGDHYLYALRVGERGTAVPFQTNGDVWWCDMPVREFGDPGSEVVMFAITKFRGEDGRGLMAREFEKLYKMGGMTWQPVAKWAVV